MVAEKAIPFPEALDQFQRFCDDHPIWTFNLDYGVFLQNIEYHGLANPFSEPFTRVKPMLTQFGVDPNKYSSGTLYKAAGLDMGGVVSTTRFTTCGAWRGLWMCLKNARNESHTSDGFARSHSIVTALGEKLFCALFIPFCNKNLDPSHGSNEEGIYFCDAFINEAVDICRF